VTGRRILWRSPNESLPIGDYKQIQCINYGGDTGRMFPEAQNQHCGPDMVVILAI